MHLIRNFGDYNVFNPGADNLYHQINNKVMGQYEEQNLQEFHCHVPDCLGSGGDILILTAYDKDSHVGIEIRDTRIQYVQKIDDMDVGDIRHILNQIVQERSQCRARNQNKAADHLIHPFEQLHDGFDLLIILLRNRPVKRIGYCRSHAKFRQGQQREDIREQSV